MTAAILLAILVAIGMIALGILFLLNVKKMSGQGKQVKCILAVVGAIIDLVLFVNLIVHLIPFTVDGTIESSVLSILIGTVLTWLSAAYLKKRWVKLLVLLSPLFFFSYLIIFIGLPIMMGADMQLSKNEVKYNNTEELSQVLEGVSLPEMNFSGAWLWPEGYKVNFRLVNPADSTLLSKAYENIKVQNLSA